MVQSHRQIISLLLRHIGYRLNDTTAIEIKTCEMLIMPYGLEAMLSLIQQTS
jgi:hypothetical protein